jgi:AraC family transcriptional regulator
LIGKGNFNVFSTLAGKALRAILTAVFRPGILSFMSAMRILPQGRFFGASQFDHRLKGISLAHLKATVPEHEVEEHSHEGAHFVLVTRGQYLSTARGDRHSTKLIYNPPGVVHRDCFKGDVTRNPSWFMALGIDKARFDAISEGMRAIDSDALCLSHPQALRCAFSLLLAGRETVADALHIESLSQEMLAITGRERPLSRHQPQSLKLALDYIDAHFASEVTITDIAVVVGVHSVYLARLFRQWLRMTPGEALRQRRVAYAADRLSQTNEALSDIALSAGFCDQSHLNRVFRAQYALTPETYRRLTQH